MRKLVFVGVLLLTILLQLIIHYRGVYTPPTFERLDFEETSVVKAPVEDFKDEFTSSEGTVVFDMAHSNEVDIKELSVLVSRLTARGYKVEYLESGSELEDKLKYADAFVVISPTETYSREQNYFLSRFVEKNGKLLLVHDPTRSDFINTLSVGFGVTFDSGYLYNQLENDGNYQYIFVEDLESNDITEGISKFSMYVASSISSTGKALAYTDDNTFSSTQTKRRFTPMVLASGGEVLALGDLSFMLEPYNSVFDNNKLVSNIADFLTKGGRTYHITDHPYYLGDDYFLYYTEDSLLDNALGIKNKIGRRATLRSDDPGFGATLIVSTYNSTKAKKYLEEAGIGVNDKLEIRGVGELQKEGSFIVALTQRADRRVLLIVSDDKSGLEEAESYLDKLDEISINDFLAYFTYEPDKKEIPSPPSEPEEEQTMVEGEEAPANLSSEGQVFEGKVIIIQPK